MVALTPMKSQLINVNNVSSVCVAPFCFISRCQDLLIGQFRMLFLYYASIFSLDTKTVQPHPGPIVQAERGDSWPHAQIKTQTLYIEHRL